LFSISSAKIIPGKFCKRSFISYNSKLSSNSIFIDSLWQFSTGTLTAVAVRSKFGKIEKEEVSLTDKFLYVRDYLQEHRRFSFRQLLQKQKSKMHVVVTFLAILEMMKLGEIYVEQESTCGEIMIERKGDVV
jgi:nitrate reductase alpha subunit